ncbi:hypothetical protein H2198_004279 [Neophaeococcomyces mojaviensis]|uniref:Uncharacterized protein n=1 Tax=Neophaeococcomyces mojaviensis TaxID=3383035 RepID=A0ACC3A9D5_9EURO|nr:hypothetical protein H2198_004279 [Knufia sp. JES_112]
MSVTTVNLLALASNPLYFDTLAATNITQPAISLLSYDPSFTQSVIYPNATARLLSQPGWQAYHEGGVYDSATHALYVSSNYQSLADNINMTIVHLNQNWTVANVTSSQFPNLWEANGGTSYYPPGSDTSKPPPQQVWCDEGDFQHYSGLVAIDPAKNTSTVLLNSFLGGHNFSSVNDVRQHPITGDLWFTDAAYGYFQNFRPVPSIPQQVYRFEPATGVLQVIADGFDQPNGLELSPDLQTLYVTDTGAQHQTPNATRPATIYAFNISADHKTLSNRRTFAYADTGFPDGIHADNTGNVWAGCGDGVHVWNPQGKLLGKVFIGETSNNFAFGPDGNMWVFSNERMWEVRGLRVVGREVCKDWYGLDSCGIPGSGAPK